MEHKTLKKVIAMALLAIYLFNIGGHLLLHQYFSFTNNKFFDAQTEKGLYNVKDLTEVKIPVNLPGITDWTSYVNVNGQVQFENGSYNYVKMKITSTAIYIMCVPNYETTRLFTNNIINAKNIPGVPIPQKGHLLFGKTTFLANFNFSFTQYTFIAPFKNRAIAVLQPLQQLTYHALEIPEQPPKFFC